MSGKMFESTTHLDGHLKKKKVETTLYYKRKQPHFKHFKADAYVKKKKSILKDNRIELLYKLGINRYG